MSAAAPRVVQAVERARPDLTLESRETTVKYIWANIALNIQTTNETRNTKNMACDESHSLNTGVLKALTDATACAPWLKVIITSRQEVDIQRFFDGPTQTSHLRCDLTADEETTSDLRIFAEHRFNKVASTRHFQSPWPEPSLLDRLIDRAAGLFIFIETLASALIRCHNANELLARTLHDSAGPGLASLYDLYASIVKARRVRSGAEFKRVIGVFLITAPYRPLCEETIAELAGVNLDLVKMWVEDLGSLFYRDEGAGGGIRVRHLSISDSMIVRATVRSTFETQIWNWVSLASRRWLNGSVSTSAGSKIPGSRNADVKGLASRIKENISDALQYSSLYWSNHLCFTPDTGEKRVWDMLRKFFEGQYPLFWVEVLSIMRMLGIGVPSLRALTSKLVKVSTVVSGIPEAILIYE